MKAVEASMSQVRRDTDNVRRDTDNVRRDTDNLHGWNRMEVLWKRAETLRAVRDEIEGNESEAEAMVTAYKQVSQILIDLC
jgi:hypothetical protein